eukprot:TRINITY_DN11725_c0_g2_i5.p1 TRINITY_DN11725_c0_g2~~TRINITY_DN11725_c0_g2_i5.p1  ORF type:complete len:220 (-),score=38.41 TRINITY_DN11725_c0_g2_i5:16-675(-)
MSSRVSTDIKRNAKLAHIFQTEETTFARTDGDTVHFLVTSKKGPNYLKYCNHIALPSDSSSILRQYSQHDTELYAQLNLSLASDSPSLSQYGAFIDDLRAAVLEKPLLDDCLLYRGVELSDLELREMEALRKFFIPSFTSTSIDSQKAYAKNSKLIIKTPYLSKYACSMTSELSAYHEQEREVLLACYSAFYLEKVENVNGVKFITLFLDDVSSSSDAL